MLLTIERAVATIRSSDPGGDALPQCGHLARAHCWRRIAQVADGHRSWCGATANIGRSPSRT